MKINSILEKEDSSFSFEFFPPKDSEAYDEFTNSFHFYSKFNPKFISITYGAGGSTRDKTFSLVKFIKENFSFPVMPHLTSITHTKEEIKEIMNSYKNIGIENILALRGDVPKWMENFDFSKVYFKDALTLVKYIKEEFDDTFCIAVSAYPEGYPLFKDLYKETDYLKEKLNYSDFAITQMFFDNRYFYEFVNICNKKGITKPIIPGIMPITNFTQISEFSKNVGATIPKDIESKFIPFLTKKEEMEKIGLEVALYQIQDLISNGFKKIHLYTLNRKNIIENIFSSIDKNFKAL
ncbi:MAG: methylenetetrahydrofolate reductase [Brevinematia bacterium]